ncbi:MAG: putative ABC transporter permease [Eubacteriaceae bacterium]|nr:putative ABC transporter permease [Eubacteriaceae bacterium]
MLYAFYEKRELINRGFLYGPFCPMYGLGLSFILMIFNMLKSDGIFDFYSSVVGLFLFSFFFGSVLEYLVGVVLEKMFHTRWWDYTDNKFNINGLISLEFSIMWGIGGVLVIRGLNPYIAGLIDRIPHDAGRIFLMLMTAYLIVDIIFTVKAMVDYRVVIEKMQHLSRDISDNILESIEELEEKSGVIGDEVVSKFQELKEEIKEQKEHFHDTVYVRYVNYISNVSLSSIAGELRNEFDEFRERRQRANENRITLYEQLRRKLANSRLTRAFPNSRSKFFDKTLNSIKELRNKNKE